MGAIPTSPTGALLVTVRITNPATGATADGVGRLDTGADTSLIDPGFAALVGAVATGSSVVQGVLGGPTTEPDYILDVTIPGVGTLPGAGWTADPVRALGYDALIGLNILSTGTLDVDWPRGTFTAAIGTAARVAAPAGAPSWLPVVAVGLLVVGFGVAIGASLAP